LELAKTHTVVGTYRGRRDAAESLQAECGADIVQSDIGSPADREALIAHVRAKYGRLDLLVNNAGIAPRERKDILEATEEVYDEFWTQPEGPYFLTQLAARLMVEQGRGRIVFVTSISAYTASGCAANTVSPKPFGNGRLSVGGTAGRQRHRRLRGPPRHHPDRHD